jgi:hypothetical protein
MAGSRGIQQNPRHGFDFFGLSGGGGDLTTDSSIFCLIIGLAGRAAVLNWRTKNYSCAGWGSEQRLLLKEK